MMPLRRVLLLVPVVLLAAACELTEVTLATPEDIIVAEILLRAGEPVQRAYLHRTGGTGGSARVFGAQVRVHDEARATSLLFEVGADSMCVDIARPQAPGSIGTCYVGIGTAATIRPGQRYTLSIDVADRVMTAATQVPGPLTLLRPAQPVCELPADSTLLLEWMRADGAWVYVAEARLTGLREALRSRGVQVPAGRGVVDLTGLSVGGADTTMLFPTAFGVFERFDADLHPLLVAIGEGLPPGVTTNITLAAGDRNYVNWVRGGSFNPSGQIRTPSIHGDGTGVFGSVVTRQVRLVSGSGTGNPRCSS